MRILKHWSVNLIRGLSAMLLAILLLIIMETLGASNTWLHALGTTLVLGRCLHYLAMTEMGPAIFRPVGMVATFAIYLAAPIWILGDLI